MNQTNKVIKTILEAIKTLEGTEKTEFVKRSISIMQDYFSKLVQEQDESLSYKDRARLNKAPISYGIYKGIKGNFGALRFLEKKAYKDQKDEGCVFLEACPAIGENNYDWQNQKISISLNLTDIGQILNFFSNPNSEVYKTDRRGNPKPYPALDIFHDNNHIDQKTLKISKDPTKNNFMFFITKRQNNQELAKASIPVSPEEAIIIGTLLRSAITEILSW